MSRPAAVVLACAALAALLPAGAPAVAGGDIPAGPGAGSPTARIIVAHRPQADAGARRAVRARAGARRVEGLGLAGVELVEVAADRLQAALTLLRRDPGVRYAERDAVVRALGTIPPALWGLHRIGTAAAWDAVGKGAGVTVGVVDTGVYAAHEDLATQVVPGRGFVGANTTATDTNGHGTHVAATIAGDDDDQGVVGVAPAARIMPLRVLDGSGVGSLSAVVSAFAYAGERGVRIVNASVGVDIGGRPFDDAVRAHPNTLYVVAAGNDGRDVDVAPTFPCVSPPLNLICVGASTEADGRAGFSNYGRRSVDLFAPGERILSAWLLPTNFRQGDGTSFAAPHVAGVAALLLGRTPSLSAVALKNAILAGADPLPALGGSSVTGGRLNALAAGTAVPADVDGDGIGDRWDLCAQVADPAQGDIDADGIGDACDDSDADRVPDSLDKCPATPALRSTDGCAETIDTDGDGLPDRLDRCPTLPGAGSADGCPAPRDRDADGVPDAADRCDGRRGRRPTGCPVARIASVSAGVRRCSRARRCVRVRVRLGFRARVSVTVQRRRCDAEGCRWKRYLARTVRASDRDVTVVLVEPPRRPIDRGRYRAKVRARTPAGRSRVGIATFRAR